MVEVDQNSTSMCRKDVVFTLRDDLMKEFRLWGQVNKY